MKGVNQLETKLACDITLMNEPSLTPSIGPGIRRFGKERPSRKTSGASHGCSKEDIIIYASVVRKIAMRFSRMKRSNAILAAIICSSVFSLA